MEWIKKKLIKLGLLKDKNIIKTCKCGNDYVDYRYFEKRHLPLCALCLPF